MKIKFSMQSRIAFVYNIISSDKRRVRFATITKQKTVGAGWTSALVLCNIQLKVNVSSFDSP